MSMSSLYSKQPSINWYKIGFEEIPTLIKVSEDNKYFAICDHKNAMIKVFDSDTYELISSFGDFQWKNIYALSFYQNDKLLAHVHTISGDEVVLIDIIKNEKRTHFSLGENKSRNVDFSVSGKYFTLLKDDNDQNLAIEIWDVEEKSKLYDYHYDNIHTLNNRTITYDEKYLVCKDRHGIIYTDILSGIEKYEFVMPNIIGSRILCTYDSNIIIAYGGDFLSVYDLNFNTQLSSLLWSRSITDLQSSIIQNPETQELIVMSRDSLYIIDITNGETTFSKEKDSYCRTFNIAKNDNYSFLICAGTEIKLKSYSDLENIFEYDTFWELPSVAITSDSKYALTYTSYNGTELWNIESGEKLKTFDFELKLFGNRNQYYIINDSTELFLYDLFTDELIDSYDLPVKTKIIYFDDSLKYCQLISYDKEHYIYIYDFINKEIKAEYKNYYPPLYFSPTCRMFAGYEYTNDIITVRNFFTNKILLEISGIKINYKVFSQDEEYFYTKHNLGEINRYNIKTGKLIDTFNDTSFANYGTPVVPIPGNKYLFENAHREFRIWDIEDNEIIMKWNDWIGKSKNCVLSNNYKYVLAAYTDGSVVCYKVNFDFETSVEKEENIFNPHPNPATSHITVSLGEDFISAPEIDIIDYLGNAFKPVYEINGSEITINTSSLSPRVYYLRIRSGSQIETRKFVVVR